MVQKILGILVLINVCLSAASLALHKLVEKFPSLAEADSILGKIVGMVQKVVDFASANVAHPVADAAPAPAAVAAPAAPAPDAPKA